MSAGGIVVAYAGVHQAYHLALAAQETGAPAKFYCSLYDAPGKWGARFGGFVGDAFFAGRRVEGLDLDNVIEFPWPLVWKAARDRVYRRGRERWLSVNAAFDRWVAKRLERSPPEIFVGTATSDLHSLEAGRRNGTTLLHDCPGLHPLFEARVLQEAADRAGIRTNARTRRNPMQARKLSEYSLADRLLVYSDVHVKSFVDAGFPAERLFKSPLWADPGVWYRDVPLRQEAATANRPLKVLFVGSISLHKGIPFLIRAIADCGSAVHLTIVGPRNSQSNVLLGPDRDNVTCLPPQPKRQLRKTYEAHDVLVLPTVGDSFGFVALEAMACGLPVVMTENCGAPTPEPDWRVPAMDARSLAERILKYADDRSMVGEHGHKAIAFAAGFGPERYRSDLRTLFQAILDGRKTCHAGDR